MSSDERIVDFLFEMGHLSATPRSGFALLGTGPQSVAEHSFRMALVGYLLARIEGSASPERVALLCLVHDLPEARTGDLHSVAKRYLEVDRSRLLAEQLGDLPVGEIADLLAEYEVGQTPAARLAQEADQLELLLTLREQEARGQARASDWIDRTVERLQTAVGRRIAQAIIGGDPSGWYESIGRSPDPTDEPKS